MWRPHKQYSIPRAFLQEKSTKCEQNFTEPKDLFYEIKWNILLSRDAKWNKSTRRRRAFHGAAISLDAQQQISLKKFQTRQSEFVPHFFTFHYYFLLSKKSAHKIQVKSE